MEGGGSERRRPSRSKQEACFWRASRRLASRRERLSDSEEKPPWKAAKANEGGSEEASRRLASSEKGKNRAVRRKSDRLPGGFHLQIGNGEPLGYESVFLLPFGSFQVTAVEKETPYYVRIAFHLWVGNIGQQGGLRTSSFRRSFFLLLSWPPVGLIG